MMDKKELAQKCLDEKWYLLKKYYDEFEKKIFSLKCAFCDDCESVCKDCKINKQICDESGSVGIFNKFTDFLFNLEGSIFMICDELKKMVDEPKPL